MTNRAIAETEAGEVNLLEARRYGDHVMRRLRELAAAREVIEASHREQIGEIEQWYTQEVGRLDAEAERLKTNLRPMVAALVDADPLRKKSVEFTAGRAGFRAGRDRVIVDDAEECMKWLEGEAPDLLRVKREPDIAALKARMLLGEVFSGVHLEPGDASYYVETVGAHPTHRGEPG